MWALSRSHNLQPLRPASARVESRRVSGQWVPSPWWVRLGQSAERCRRSQTLSPRGGCPPARRAAHPNSRPPAAVGSQEPAAARGRPAWLAHHVPARVPPAQASPGRRRHLLEDHLLSAPGAGTGSGLTVRAENFCAGAGGSSPASSGSQQSWGSSMVPAGRAATRSSGREPGGGATSGPHPTTPGGRTRPAALPARSAPPRPSRLAWLLSSSNCRASRSRLPLHSSLPARSSRAPPPAPAAAPAQLGCLLGPKGRPGRGSAGAKAPRGRQALL